MNNNNGDNSSALNIVNKIVKYEDPAQNEPENISIKEHQNEIKPPSSLNTQNQGNNQIGLNQAQSQNNNGNKTLVLILEQNLIILVHIWMKQKKIYQK